MCEHAIDTQHTGTLFLCWRTARLRNGLQAILKPGNVADHADAGRSQLRENRHQSPRSPFVDNFRLADIQPKHGESAPLG
jgi:hypothetical protein